MSVLPCVMAAEEPRLRRLTPEVLGITETFLVIPPDHQHTVRIRLTMDYLIAHFEAHEHLLAGRLD